jgi:hypothetical protein
MRQIAKRQQAIGAARSVPSPYEARPRLTVFHLTCEHHPKIQLHHYPTFGPVEVSRLLML